MTSSGASYLCLPATNPNRIQPESNRNPLAQLQHQLLDIIHMHTRLGRGSTQKKSFLPGTAASAPRPPPALAPAPAWGGLLLRLLSAVLPANLAGSGTRHQAPGTRHQGTSAPARTHTEAEAEVIPDKQCVEGKGGTWGAWGENSLAAI